MEWTNAKMEEVCKNTELKFKNEKAKSNYEKCVEKNKDDMYGIGVIKYMDRWAKCMQYLIEKEGYRVPDAAKETEFVCDTQGITGFMYGLAVRTLCATWKYGKDLRKWHNHEFNYEGEGVVNPAVLGVEDK